MMFGVIVSAIIKKNDGTKDLSYWTSTRIDNAPVFTFFWSEIAFVPGFAIEYFLPLLICSFITTAETVGDVGMTAKFSRITDEVRASRNAPRPSPPWTASAPSPPASPNRGRGVWRRAGRDSRADARRRARRRHQLRHRVHVWLAAEHHLLAEQRHHRAHAVRLPLGGLRVRRLAHLHRPLRQGARATSPPLRPPPHAGPGCTTPCAPDVHAATPPTHRGMCSAAASPRPTHLVLRCIASHSPGAPLHRLPLTWCSAAASPRPRRLARRWPPSRCPSSVA